jgi:hypothetical protein
MADKSAVESNDDVVKTEGKEEHKQEEGGTTRGQNEINEVRYTCSDRVKRELSGTGTGRWYR